MTLLSIVVPCYNEQETVSLFYDATSKVVDKMDMDYEIIFVNDGSKDKTLEECVKLYKKHPDHVRVIDFSRNFGKEGGLLAGLEYAAKVNMTDFLDSEPTHLSGGQKQRVAIAGVLAMHPDIIIFDESTSMLDPQGKDEIKKFIYHLHENKELTIISITHDIEEVSSSDHVIVMNDGKVVMDGKPDDVLYRTDELVKIQLDVPFALKLQSALAKKGINVGKCLDLESLVDEIWQLSLKK